MRGLAIYRLFTDHFTMRKSACDSLLPMILLLATAGSVYAQSGPTLWWDESSASVVSGYAVTIDGVRTDYGLSPLAPNGTCGCAIVLPFSGGRHVITVSVYNSSGETTSAPLTVGPMANAGGPYTGQSGTPIAVNASGSNRAHRLTRQLRLAVGRRLEQYDGIVAAGFTHLCRQRHFHDHADGHRQCRGHQPGDDDSRRHDRISGRGANVLARRWHIFLGAKRHHLGYDLWRDHLLHHQRHAADDELNQYTGAVTVSSTETIQAVAVASGHSQSAVASASYTINAGTPTFTATASANPTSIASSGSSTISFSVKDTGAALSNANVEVQVFNSSGTAVGTGVFSGQNFAANGTLSFTYIWSPAAQNPAVTAAGNYTVMIGVFNSSWATNYYWNSNAATIALTVPAAATPTFSPAAGTYTSAQSVTISDTTSGATIYYTINGVTPTTSSTRYTGAVSVSSTEAILAIAVASRLFAVGGRVGLLHNQRGDADVHCHGHCQSDLDSE